MTTKKPHDPGPAGLRGIDRAETYTTGLDAARTPDPAAAAAETGAGDDLESLKAALAEQSDRYVRLAADFENFRRRKAQELIDRSRYASEDAARALLPVLDNMRRAIDHAPEGTDAVFLDGLRLTIRQFEDALATLGVTPIVAVGEPFDPSLHEAVLGEESDEVDRDTVVEEIQRGYKLHDRVIRPAMVKVMHPAHGAAAPRS